MKIFKSLYRFCSGSVSNQLVKYRHFTQLQSKALIEKPNQLRETLVQHLETFGELTIQRYWKTALTDPSYGYYIKNNVFSKQGDFTTSPQISPLFGQMFGVWIAYFLKKTGVYSQQTQTVVKRFRIVELGGGRGFFIKDILRTLTDLNINNGFDVSFIEVSQYNRKAQQDSVMNQFKEKQHFFKYQHQKSNNKFQLFSSQNPEKNVNLSWHETIEDLYQYDISKQKNGDEIPFTVFVMNQFMDALPITILRYTQQGWKQKVLKKSINENLSFQLGISSKQVPEKMVPVAQNVPIGQEIQVSPLSLLTIDLLAKMIQKYGGAILNVDYGEQGTFSDSIRAIKDHKYIPSPYFWQIPGQCDLSAYVNFQALGQFAEKNEGIISYEAIPQGYFLQAMGIVPRVDLLKQKASQQQKRRLESQYERLVLPSEMGQIYKVQIITKKEYGEIYPHITENQYSF